MASGWSGTRTGQPQDSWFHFLSLSTSRAWPSTGLAKTANFLPQFHFHIPQRELSDSGPLSTLNSIHSDKEGWLLGKYFSFSWNAEREESSEEKRGLWTERIQHKILHIKAYWSCQRTWTQPYSSPGLSQLAVRFKLLSTSRQTETRIRVLACRAKEWNKWTCQHSRE